MRRTPGWAIALLLVVIAGLAVYAYFTTPLPFGLSSVIRTPGGANVPPATNIGGLTVSTPGRTPVGQALVLGAANLSVQSVQRNQDLASSIRGPVGSFSVIQLELQNGGNEPVVPQPNDFRLIDDRGRSYAVDLEATRAVNAASRRRYPFEASVSPGTRLSTQLAFETPPDVGGLTLRVALGYGELELPR